MVKLKAFLVLLTLALLTSACGQQQAPTTAAALPDNKENRQAAAKKYLEVVPPQEMLQDFTERALPTLPENKRALFKEVMGRKSLQEFAYRVTQDTLVKHFTANEIQAMTNFYGSPEGKAIRPKMGSYTADLMPQIVKEVVKDLQGEEKAQAPPGPPAGGAPAAPPKPGEPKKPQEPAKPMTPAAPQPKPEPKAPPEAKPQPAPPPAK